MHSYILMHSINMQKYSTKNNILGKPDQEEATSWNGLEVVEETHPTLEGTEGCVMPGEFLLNFRKHTSGIL